MMLSHHRGLASLTALPVCLAFASSDVSIEIYRDEHCFEKTGTLLLEAAGEACYANTFDPDQSSAFSVKTVDFTPNNERFTVSLYKDDCKTPETKNSFGERFTVHSGACEPVLGTTYGIYTVRYRNEERSCHTADAATQGGCSLLRVAVYSRYDNTDCSGTPVEVEMKPASSGECLRAENGTQVYVLASSSSNMTLQDFEGSHDCLEEPQRVINIFIGACYPLGIDQSFMWTISVDPGRIRFYSDKMVANTDTPVLTKAEWMAKLDQRRESEDVKMTAMYSSYVGGITFDKSLMSLPLDDFMVHRGMGVYDTATVTNGHLWNFSIHCDRFLESARKAGIKSKWNRDDIYRIVDQVVAATALKEATVRLWMTAGPSGAFGINPEKCVEPCLYIVVFPSAYVDTTKPDAKIQVPAEVVDEVTVSSDVVPFKPPMLASCKSNNYLLNAHLFMEAQKEGGHFGIWVDEKGTVKESCTMSVVMMTKKGEVVGPAFDGGILKGTTMRRIFEICAAQNPPIPVVQREINKEELYDAKEVVMCGGDTHIVAAVKLDGHQIGDGKKGSFCQMICDGLSEEMATGKGRKSEDYVPIKYNH
ncbi:hypothetical protein FOL46_008180 [Perkinsus olseni]|uniref:Branched-chain-amino-acid aminotransferase n=1 Tax=Perkinsus olseni TaxID=32597 RepID=A0A7J6L960_PEROL|nr:hypothetical protein FOL46_008180 [Perkinsus olseni]